LPHIAATIRNNSSLASLDSRLIQLLRNRGILFAVLRFGAAISHILALRNSRTMERSGYAAISSS
jgi:hypothetical protein